MKKTLILLFPVLFAVVVVFTYTQAAADKVNYTYDNAGRLVKASYDSGQTIAYTYDKSGNLLKREVASGVSGGDGGSCFITSMISED